MPMTIPDDFWQVLLEIHRYRLLRLMLNVHTDSSLRSPQQAAVLALLWEVDARQKGEPSRRFKAADLGLALGLTATAWSDQTGPLSRLDLCETLPKEPGQKDRRNTHYVITEKGKRALNDWLKQQYNLPEGIYSGVAIDRARQALEKLRTEVKIRMKPILP